MSATIVHSRSLGALPHAGGIFGWMWTPTVNGSQLKGSQSTPGMDRLPSSSSTWSSQSESASDAYSRSSSSGSSSSSHSCADDGIAVRMGCVPDASEMRKVFERFDENNDGLICSRDLHRFMGRLGIDMSEEEAKSMLQGVDHKVDGCVDFDEFYSLYMSLLSDSGDEDEDVTGEEEHPAGDEDDTLLQVFKVFDRNGDGLITPQELQEVLIKLGIPEGRNIRNCERMIQRVDSNGDKKIDIAEFKTMMCSNCFHNPW